MCRCFVKIILFIVNLLFTLIGLALIGIGVVVLVNLNDENFDQLLAAVPFNLKLIPYFVIGIGSVIFLIAFCGCCGSATESKCMLITYAVCMALLAAAKIYVAVQLSVSLDTVQDSVETELNNLFEDPNLNVTFQAIESTLSCCGTTGPDSYNLTASDGTEYVPISCCGKEANNDGLPLCLKEDAFEDGCNSVVASYIEMFSRYSRNILIYVIVAEGLAFVFAVYISCTIKKRK